MKFNRTKLLKPISFSILGLISINNFFAADASLSTESQKQSYSMGVVVGKQILNSISQDDFNVDKSAFTEGLIDIINNKNIKLSNDEIQKNLLNFTRKQSESYSSQVEEKAKSHVKELLNSKDVPVIGNPKANFTIVEFFDYNCAHCKLMAKPLKQLIENNKDVKLLLRNYPIMGGNSNYAAKAVLWAALKKDNSAKYVKLHDSLLSHTAFLKKQDIDNIIKTSGLDSKALAKELNSMNINKLIENNFKLASELGLKGTPSMFFINDKTGKFKFISGEVTNEAELQKILDELK